MSDQPAVHCPRGVRSCDCGALYCEVRKPLPPPENPLIARLQVKHFAALDEGDWDEAVATLLSIQELRNAIRTLPADIKKEQTS